MLGLEFSPLPGICQYTKSEMKLRAWNVVKRLLLAIRIQSSEYGYESSQADNYKVDTDNIGNYPRPDEYNDSSDNGDNTRYKSTDWE